MATDATSPPTPIEPSNAKAAPEVSPGQPWLTWAASIACVGIFLGLSSEKNAASWEVLSKWGAFPGTAIWDGAYWGLFTSVFVHYAIWHVAFNVYWLWVLGSQVEKAIGSLYYLAFFAGAAIVSSSLQLAISDQTGIGASGVVYAIFGFMWPLRGRFPEFGKLLDQRTVGLFVVWLIGCFIMTYLKIWDVGNAAHLSGLLFGCLVAGSFVAPYHRRLALSGLVVMVVLSVVLLFWCPWSITWLSNQAFQAHQAQRYADAFELYTRILRMDPTNAWALYNRSGVYEALGQVQQSEADLVRALQLDPKIANAK
jgi:GlpG protein